MNLTERVAFRYMRQAGVFEAPPAMLEAIGAWFAEIYAGHVLARVEKQLVEVRATESVVDRQIKEMKAAQASVERDVKSLPSGKTVKYPLYARREGRVRYIGVRRVKNTWRDPERPKGNVYVVPPLKPKPDYEPIYEVGETPRSGAGLTGPKQLNFLINYGAPGQTGTVEDVADYVRKRIDRALTFFEGVTPGGKQEPAKLDAKIVELILLERECKKYAPAAKAYRARAQRSFPVDLRGWKYLADIKRHYEQGKQPAIELTPRALAKLQKLTRWEEIKVVLNFKPYEKSVGTWYEFKREMRVDVRTVGSLSPTGFTHRYWVEKFQEAMAETLRTLRHELQHVGQDVFTALMDLKSEAGTPARDLGLSKPTRGRKPHPLREEEFYTRLADEIVRFVRHVRKHGDPRKNFDEWITRTDFFHALRVKEPAKWRKAVKEFAKGIAEAGIDVPGKEHEGKMDSALLQEIERYEKAEPWKTQRDAINKWLQTSPYFKKLSPSEREEKEKRFKELLRARH